LFNLCALAKTTSSQIGIERSAVFNWFMKEFFRNTPPLKCIWTTFVLDPGVNFGADSFRFSKPLVVVDVRIRPKRTVQYISSWVGLTNFCNKPQRDGISL